MTTVEIIFHKCIIDSQDIGSNDDHVISRIFFSISSGAIINKQMHVDIIQPYGEKFSYANSPLEVQNPFLQDKMPFNYMEFRDAVERVYRKCLGVNSKEQALITIEGSENIRLRNCTFKIQEFASLKIIRNSHAW